MIKRSYLDNHFLIAMPALQDPNFARANRPIQSAYLEFDPLAADGSPARETEKVRVASIDGDQLRR